ncbi:MAG: acyl carrier protein [Butyrivibrio sp.]|jgi:acyl carrier protein|nr:acyl carrier protein [Butyrivibrio sp.]
MTLDEIKTIIADTLGVDEDKVTPEANLIEDLDADSLAIVELHMEIEEKLGVKIPDEAITDLHTVQDVLDAIKVNKVA